MNGGQGGRDTLGGLPWVDASTYAPAFGRRDGLPAHASHLESRGAKRQPAYSRRASRSGARMRRRWVSIQLSSRGSCSALATASRDEALQEASSAWPVGRSDRRGGDDRRRGGGAAADTPTELPGTGRTFAPLLRLSRPEEERLGRNLAVLRAGAVAVPHDRGDPKGWSACGGGRRQCSVHPQPLSASSPPRTMYRSSVGVWTCVMRCSGSPYWGTP
jgi:hypothetical protein